MPGGKAKRKPKPADDDCKALGNQHFARGEYAAAIELYSRAILEGAGGDDAALARLYSNRSAAWLARSARALGVVLLLKK